MKRIILKLYSCVSASFFAGTFACMLLTSLAFADNQVSQQQLDAVTHQLAKNKHAIGQAKALLATLQKNLKQDELAISNQQAKISKTITKVHSLQRQLSQLQDQATALEQQQEQQQKLLKAQIAAAYQMGKGSYLKMLLNQNKAAELDRLMDYYQYLNKARFESIQKLEQTTEQLKQNQVSQRQNLATLKSVLATQQKQQKQLLAQKSQRQQTVKKTNQLLANSQLKKEQLEQAKNYLNEQLATPSDEAVDIHLTGLKRHQLNWPVKGKIIHDYQQSQLGGNRWEGVVIKAKAGTPVKAVADGKVVFADWLRGYGLVIVLSHGHHYLSLYGYNQELLLNVGDSVKKGETIATVGNTGGRPENSLFFQIRYKSRVENPHWFIRN
ncbi:septal ring factor EnvC (AmiA/AmiB activator) [Celerinatantimonas diazotrophica]|uniref:Septal ring factor EnvC (AmiA/AmiB activator) n=2 Tax=Celerinatantimonas diazotrophica TaxID=412034 RepID=A0A4R1J9M9_9GAMM|nr:septal ring factor EnvC (AmiA/AmiB activator) [Celerinatantimonas diazotrophica]CAG9295512.1 Murein hydrolase activator EnvC [Celerinatantimonas diazotrophica]